jgi:DNA-binding CsgD family transcriptional regulator
VTEHLSNASLSRALQTARGLAELEQLADFPAWSASALRHLIPCDVASYNAVDPVTQRADIAVDPAESVFDGGVEVFAHYVHQNPLVGHYAATGDGRALRISDFITLRELHRTDLYAHVYRQLELEHQLAITLPAPRHEMDRPGEVIGLTLGRRRTDFSDSERVLLERLRGSFAATLARLHELALLRATTEGEPDRGVRWLVLIARDATTAWTTPAAAEGLGLIVGERLPPALCRWVDAERSRQQRAERRDEDAAKAYGDSSCPRPLVDGSLPVHLQLRLVRGAYPGLDALHLRPVEALPGANALRALNLTPRQAEVMALALEGRTSAQIALALRLSTRTVEKHFEAIYDRLGAANRGQAISIALQANGNGRAHGAAATATAP